MRLGDRLVAAGVVERDAIEEALGAQMTSGARLGTNLVELFHVDLDVLAKALADQHGVDPALSGDFEQPDPELQRRLPLEIAARWHAVPLRSVGGDALVAVTDVL